MDKYHSIKLKEEAECTGCGACVSICPRGAISKKKVGLGAWIPQIDLALCIECGLCEKTCNSKFEEKINPKQAYIAYNRNLLMRKISSSGGAFSALATYILDQGGSVYGAELFFEDGKAVVEHNRITHVKDLPRLLGSKYVQSDCIKAYKKVKKDLLTGKIVLFSGCSCQIVGLKNYLGDVDKNNLYTIDLICHGVPGIDFFNSYIMFLEKKHGGKIKNLSFRSKEENKIIYRVTAEFDGGGVIFETIFRIDIKIEEQGDYMKKIGIPMNKSGYFLMFMGQQSYREACYKCPHATINKPADITLGDYFEAKKDYPEFFEGKDSIDDSCGVSCVIAHTDKGKELLDKAIEYIYLKEVSPSKVQNSHGNLQKPSRATKERNILLKGYSQWGYGFIDIYYKIREDIVKVPRKVKNVIKIGKLTMRE